jgi:hypothetical protein
MPYHVANRGPNLLSQLTEFALGCGLVVGLLLLLAGASDPDPSALRPWVVQLLPLSGFVVVGATIVGIRTMRLPTSVSRAAGARLIGIAVILVAVATWIVLASATGQGLGSLLGMTALPPFVAGVSGVVQGGQRKAAV